MPLFIYKCVDCEKEIEKFQHNNAILDIVCSKCGGKCERQFPETKNRIKLNARDTYEQVIKPDVDRISKKISEGSDKYFLDVCGEK
jgi:putative FmdB family regulatory protein